MCTLCWYDRTETERAVILECNIVYNECLEDINMFGTKKQRICSIIAGICFAISSLFSIISVVRYGVSSFVTLLFLFAVIGMAVITFMNKKGLPFVIVSGVYALLCLVNWFIYSHLGMPEYYYIFYVITFLAYSTLAFLALINCIPALHRNTKIQRYICFVPSGLYVLSWLFQNIYLNYYYSHYYSYHYSIDFLNLLGMLIWSAALLFAGFWLVDEYKPEAVSEDFSFTHKTGAPAAPMAKSDIDATEKIMAYKNLLDEGIITQQEFEEMKKQVLDSFF